MIHVRSYKNQKHGTEIYDYCSTKNNKITPRVGTCVVTDLGCKVHHIVIIKELLFHLVFLCK